MNTFTTQTMHTIGPSHLFKMSFMSAVLHLVSILDHLKVFYDIHGPLSLNASLVKLMPVALAEARINGKNVTV